MEKAAQGVGVCSLQINHGAVYPRSFIMEGTKTDPRVGQKKWTNLGASLPQKNAEFSLQSASQNSHVDHQRHCWWQIRQI